MNSDVVTSSSEQCNSITGEDDSSNKTRIKQGRFYDNVSIFFIIGLEITDILL